MLENIYFLYGRCDNEQRGSATAANAANLVEVVNSLLRAHDAVVVMRLGDANEGCGQYAPQYPNKRKSHGPCKYSNTYGPYGCDSSRTEFCQTGPVVEICQCRRCTGEGCDETCPSFVEWGFGFCKHQNSFGQHGCPECLD